MFRSVRAILFDAVGTLIYPDPPVANAYAAIGSRFGSQLSKAKIATRFHAALHRFSTGPDCSSFATSDSSEHARWRNIVEDVFCDVPLAGGGLFDALWQHFADPSHWALFDDVPPCWSALSQRGFLLGIASNFDHRLEHVCVALPPLDTAAHVFHSAGLGFAKPGKEFFHAIEQQLGLNPPEILLVGDDPANDYRGAEAAGWQCLLVCRESDKQTVGSIQNLCDLPDYLD